ncbi:GNAT family N-acetyltransferase [Mucilaginibacter sp. BJC16-A38]|uniref:GNAT family N-acetyltransferase n=1 Tax=Mucilaginibacter phenanthrenivorans TaxID=1234842 RepID=UPI002157EE56|nr:GNAT family N-acetyltransferase [Mucilaginibacter phenanthrenivorans]MCR8557405.1 GNAT family N-acetyltransferase [Mucilaginibacter phenanthrenivorans]
MNILTETPRFIIRLFKAEEEEIYLKLFDDRRVMKYLPFRTQQDLIAVFRENLADSGTVTGRWGIFDKANGDFIGLCLLRPFDDGSEDIELGYVLHYDYWGQGAASEMAQALLVHMLTLKPGTTFVAVTDLDNIPSQKVLEKAGLKRAANYVRGGEELAYFRTADFL